MIMYSPLGGWMDVIPGDVEDMKKKGWFLEGEPGYVSGQKNPEAQSNSPVTESQVIEAVALPESLEKLREKWQEKYGKKPHHKKTARTLIAEL